MKKCKQCGLEHSEIVMVGKSCYLCVLSQWPPKSRRQEKEYKKAVSIRMALFTPLTMTQSVAVVDRVGLDRLEFLNELAKGNIVDHLPGALMYKRVMQYIDREVNV